MFSILCEMLNNCLIEKGAPLGFLACLLSRNKVKRTFQLYVRPLKPISARTTHAVAYSDNLYHVPPIPIFRVEEIWRDFWSHAKPASSSSEVTAAPSPPSGSSAVPIKKEAKEANGVGAAPSEPQVEIKKEVLDRSEVKAVENTNEE